MSETNETASTEGQPLETTETTQTNNPNPGEMFSQPTEKLYAGKYKSVEDLEKAYGEVNKLASKKAPAKADAETPSMDMGDIGKRFQSQITSGKFDDDVTAALSQFGMTPDMVTNAFKAEQVQSRATVNEAIGEEVDWDAVNSWLLDNKTEAQIKVINDSVSAGMYGNLKEMVAEFNAQAPEAVEAPVTGSSPTGDMNHSADGFKSVEEIAAFFQSSANLAKSGSEELYLQKLAATSAKVREAMTNG